jgi:hypothetical protein
LQEEQQDKPDNEEPIKINESILGTGVESDIEE